MLFKSAYSAQFFHWSLSSFSVLAWAEQTLHDYNKFPWRKNPLPSRLTSFVSEVMEVFHIHYFVFYFYFLTFWQFQTLKCCKNNTRNSYIALTKIAQTFSILSPVVYHASLLPDPPPPATTFFSSLVNSYFKSWSYYFFFNIPASFPPPPFLSHQRVLHEMKKKRWDVWY